MKHKRKQKPKKPKPVHVCEHILEARKQMERDYDITMGLKPICG